MRKGARYLMIQKKKMTSEINRTYRIKSPVFEGLSSAILEVLMAALIAPIEVPVIIMA